jgi:hypothetical protein
VTKLIALLIVFGTLHLYGMEKSKSIFELSDEISKIGSSVKKDQGTITLENDKIEKLSTDMNIHRRELLYTKPHEESYTYYKIIIERGREIAYSYEYGCCPKYEVNKINSTTKLVFLYGGYSHDSRIKILQIKNDSINMLTEYKGDATTAADIDSDGINEIVTHSCGYLIPKGALGNSAFTAFVYKYKDGNFTFSPKLTRIYSENDTKKLTFQCDLEQKTSVSQCTSVIQTLILYTALNDFARAKKIINKNMIFMDKKAKILFIKDYVHWCLWCSELSKILEEKGIQNEIQLYKIFKGK